MKRIFKYIFSLLLISSIASPALHAKQISPENAKQNAMAAVQKPNKKKKVPVLSDSSQLILKETVKDDAGNPLFYIFSRGENAGYVIAAADDRVKPVLAISHKGSFSSVENLPAPTRYLLDTYSHEIASVVSEDETAANSEEIYREPIDELLTSWWGQDKPFNNMCPIISGERAPVGCVGLATAMMLNYYQYPDAGTGTFTYTSNGASQKYSLEENPFEYDKIIEYYTGHIDDEYETRESQDAVANLCLGAALALGSNFRVDGTASSLSASVFSNYFHYPKEGLGLLKRDYFSIEEWESIVYEELAAGRPVAYEGDDGTKGHAFVIDGYDDGLFHINWGWYGDSDDYFSLSVLRPGTSGIGGNSDSNYSFNQGIVRGLRTPEADPASPLFIASQIGYDPNSNIFSLASLSSKSGWQKVKAGLELEDIESGAITVTVGSIDGSQTTVTGDEQTYTNFSVDFSEIADGVYRARPMIQLDGSEERFGFNDWYRVYCFLKNNRYVDVEVKDGKIVNAKEGSDVNYDIHFTNFQVQIPIMTSLNYRGFTMDVENNGNTFLARVNKLIYYPGTDDIVPNSDGGRETVALEPGKKKTLNMSVNTNLKVAGEYEMQIVDYDNPEIKYSDRIRFKMINSNSYSTVDGLRYIIVSEDPKTVLLYGGTFDGEVTVPETVRINDSDYAVQYVGLNVAGGSSKLTKLILPKSLISISPSSFMSCSALKEVILPDNLQYLGGNSFGSCTSLSKVNIPTSITQIYTNTFNKTALTAVEVPEGVTMIGKYAFSSAPLKHVVLPSTLESIDAYAFYHNTIDELIINAQEPPEISPYTFYSYNTRIYVPEGCEEKYKNHEQWRKFSSLYSIPTDTVFNVDGVWYEVTPEMEVFVTKPQDDTEYTLTSVNIPAVVTYKGYPYKVVGIADSAFRNVSTLKAVGGCGNVTIIGAHAFEGTSISSLSIPSNTVEIGDYAYANSKATYITHFPASLRKIGNYAFADNPDLSYRRLLDADFWFDIPATIEEIGDGAFKNCSSLNTLRFNSPVTLGENVFDNTPGLISCCLNTPDLPEWFIKKLRDQMGHTGFYIDTSHREYYSQLFDASFKLYDILKEPTFNSEETQSLNGISKIRIFFNSNLGNPKFTYGRVVFNVINAAGYVQVDDYDTYEEGYIDLIVTPTMAGNNMSISLTFEQPGLFLTIPITVETPATVISSIKLGDEKLNLNIGDKRQISSTFDPENPSDKTLVWETSDANVATVDENGMVTAVSNGMAVITCHALRGPATATCIVVVGDYLVNSISVEAPYSSLVIGRDMQLTATVLPETAQNQEVLWSSSDDSIASIDATGLVTGHQEGNVTFTATAKDGSNICGSINLNVELPAPGKAVNDPDEDALVGISDIVAICQHIMGTDVEDFNRWGADANRDGKITVSDVTTTVQIIMDQEDDEEALRRVRAISEASDDNFLHFGEIIFENSNLLVNFASLEVMDDFTVLQADIICPTNVEISNIELDNLSSHTLSWKKLNNGNYRVVVYSLSNGLLPVSPTPILKLTLNKVGNPSGAMSVTNAWVSTPEAKKSSLYASGGNVEIPTGIGTLYSDFMEPYADVFTVDGTLLKRNVEVKSLENELAPGIYILRGKNTTAKIFLK